jgi:uncharacterized damage-inducible protein DinB
MTTSVLQPEEFNLYYKAYLEKVPPFIDLHKNFKFNKINVVTFFSEIDEEKLNYRYEAEKWSIKEVFQHIIDTERIFMYRCLRIARRDTTPLAGFEQNDYVPPSGADQKSIDQLIEEYNATRDQSISIVKSLSEEDLSFIGEASGSKLSARAAAFIVLGHEIWHMDIVKERYL